jgi:hypothetical protein
MKVIDILFEVAPPGAGKIARLLLPAAARAWNAEKQAAFRQAVEALEDTLYLARSQPQPIATSQMDAYKIIQKAAPNHVADKDFAQAVFNAAEDRVAQRLSAENAASSAKPTTAGTNPAATKADDASKETLSGAQRATSNAKWLLGTGAFGAAGYDVIFNSLAEYNTNQAEFLSQVRAGKMTADQAKQADNQQKMVLVANVAAAVVFPTVVAKIPSWSAGVATWLLRVLKFTKTPPLKLKQMRDGTLLQITQADTQPTATSNTLSATKYAAWGAWLYLLNSNETINGTAGFKLYDQAGNVTGTAGRDLTPKEVVAWYAINKMWGVNAVQWASDAFQMLWNLLPDFIPGTGDTQKQAIQRAAGQTVTPNTVAKPPKVKQHDGVTLQGWD